MSHNEIKGYLLKLFFPRFLPVFAVAVLLPVADAAVGFVWPTPAAQGQSLGQPDFTAQERRQLDQGELVVRRVTQRQGSLKLMGGSSWQVVDAPPDIVWQALLDTTHYHRMVPQVLEARLVRDDGNKRTLFIRQGSAFVEVKYHVTLTVHPERKDITFNVDEDRPHTLKAGWGFYTVRPYGEGRSVLTYGIMADLGDGLLTRLIRGPVHEWMLKVPWMVKRFVESSGRWIYK